MRKGRDGGNGKKTWGGGLGGTGGKKKKRLMIIVATTSLPAVNCPNNNRWNAACSCQQNISVEMDFNGIKTAKV